MEQTYDYGLKFIIVKNVGHIVVETQKKNNIKACNCGECKKK